MMREAKAPVLSIIVTAHNSEDYIKKTLLSISRSAGSSFDSSEIILIDDASTDRTYEICHQFSQDNLNVVFYRVNFNNIGKVRNYALSKCTGQYITMVDGDDEVLPFAFEEISGLLEKENPDLYLTKLNEIYPSSQEKLQWGKLNFRAISGDRAITKFLIHKDIQAHFIGQFVRREILADMQFPEFECYEDAYLFPSILVKSSKIIFSHHGPYLYFKRDGSLSNNINKEKISLLIKATEQMPLVFKEKYKNLIACHWINLLHKHKNDIYSEKEKTTVISHLKNISLISFIFDPKVRLSMKKKYIKLRRSNFR
ncbi:hypothetical protein NG99_11365 [Erwinia typographi]|uniref:Glycosyltransferase 2-like domain-containing protein n=1 Tax=Erwinia typographi TaxID=371042 RepID=A0A0A3Z3T7_9GAMM|nr:glycosyltransferase family 2 protein [Erwinia typographi]KGT93495.1 hypothetical protein NG99_11365 [Erwinia typographi]